MRKLILISAFVLVSVSVQAVEARELILAASDSQAVAAPVPAAAAPVAAPAATPAPVASTATPAAPVATADTAMLKASRKQVSRPQQPQLRRESDEQKARRIAARYGISW